MSTARARADLLIYWSTDQELRLVNEIYLPLIFIVHFGEASAFRAIKL